MKTTRKVLAIALCAILLVGASVMGTLAYLTSTDAVTNTFTVGNVKITLDEAKVDANGKDLVEEEGKADQRVKENTYKLLPGHEYDKDPTVHVDPASENCWLFVKVENEISAIEDTNTVATQMSEKGWSAVANTTNIYAYKEVVKADDDVVVFENFKIKGDVNNDTLKTYDGKTIKITAYAIQADGFDTAAAAWTAANGQFTAAQG